jgi:hypothetical protein
MKDKVMLGVDPGTKGYIAILRIADRDVEFISNDLPPYDIYLELKKLEDKYEVVGVGLEKVHSIPKSSATSNFKFGYNVGSITALVSTMDTSIYEITPIQWQRYIGLSIPRSLKGNYRKKRIKKGVGEICSKLYPNAPIRGIKGGLLDGKSDSLMIAHTVLHKYHLANK